MNAKFLALSLIAITGAALYFVGISQKDSYLIEDRDAVEQFSNFRIEHRKVYSSLEEANYRMTVFKNTLDLINKHNSDLTSTYTLGVNQFSDLTFEEFSAYHLSVDPEDHFQEEQDQVELTDVSEFGVNEVDWVKKGIVGTPKNQGNCGSCWAFSAVSVIEELYALKKKVKGLNLSEQELVDCSRSEGNQGCNGGLSFWGLTYVIKKGINTGKDYPYHAKDEKCQPISGKGKYKIKSWKAIAPGPKPLIAGLQLQPTTASFHVQGDFQSYKSGVYNPESCPGNRNHAVNAVGFKLNAPVPYFYVRNSWGTGWCDKGYFKIAIKDGNGTCWFNGEGRSVLVSF